MFLHSTLKDWARADLASSGEIVLGELVGRAVELTGIPDPSPRWVELCDLALIRVRLVLLETGVIAEVADRYNQPPTWPEAVIAVCSRWNSYPTDAGRVVWCELAPPTCEMTERGLPKRARPKSADTNRPPATPVDTALLRRVQEGLRRL